MAYFGGSHGMRGDPGFFGTLFGAVKGAAGSIFRGSPIGRGVSGVSDFLRRRGQARSITAQPSPFAFPRISGGGVPPIPGPDKVRPDGTVAPRRRRTNFANPKALRRAISRQNGFVRVAKGALKNSGFKVVSVSAGKVSRATMDKAVEKARAAAHHAR